MKKFMALVTAAALMAGSTAMVFADETVKTPAETTATEKVAAPVAAEVKEEVKEVVKVALKVTDKSLTNSDGVIVGKVPVFTGNEELSKKAALKASDTYAQDLADNVIQAATKDLAVFSYQVTELDTVAKVELTKNITTTAKGLDNLKVYATYYIDKATNKEIKEAEYTALVPAVTPVAPVETPVETPAVVLPATLALRANAVALGYVVDWNDGKVTITKGENVATLVQSVNEYTNFEGKVVVLASAPENVEGTLMVPTAFFTDILGAVVTVNAEGVATVAPAPVAESVAVPTVEAPAEKPATVPAA